MTDRRLTPAADRLGPGVWRVADRWVASDECGTKAFGLAALPAAWGVPWLAVTLESCGLARQHSEWQSLAAACLAHLNHAAADCRLIVRSSGIDEDLDSRGSLFSEIADHDDVSVALALSNVAGQASNCAVVVQRYVEAEYWGHLSNEYKHAQRNVDFTFEIEETAADKLNAPATFRLVRPVSPPNTDQTSSPLRSGARQSRESVLRTVAAWMAAQGTRGHVEWVQRDDTFHIVQFDTDPLPPRISPMQEVSKAGHVFDYAALALSEFERLTAQTNFSNLRKTRSHATLAQAGAFVPPIFVARRIGDALELADHPFWRDLEALCATPAIIRFDVPHSRTEWTNLPTIGPCTWDDSVRTKVRGAVETAVSRGIVSSELTVVVHHFIAARAAAWSEHAPGTDTVRIDSLWGLPDGLQSFTHDSALVRLSGGKTQIQTRYKDKFIDVTAEGRWITRRAGPTLASDEACSLDDARTIAEISSRVAKNVGKTVRIMWFLDVLVGGGGETPSAMPWIVVELDEPEHNASAALTLEESDSENLRRQAELRRDRAVTGRSTLAKFVRTPDQMQIAKRHVLLQPDASVVRDRNFLSDFAREVLKLNPPWRVVYAGSMLAHAPYQLAQLGIAIVPIHEQMRQARPVFTRKLVRDRVAQEIASRGETPHVIKLSERDYLLALRQKLVEESLEAAYAADSEELRDELADVLAVLEALAAMLGTNGWAEIVEAKNRKETRRGAFRERLYLLATGGPPRGLAADQPGGIHVERTRDGRGARIPLVPPLVSSHGSTTILLRDSEQALEVEFREGAVIVRVSHAEPGAARQNTQLSLVF